MLMKDRFLWLYTGVVFLVTIIALLGMMREHSNPEPIPIMKPSYFKTASEIGTTVYRHFYAPIEQEKLVVFGVPPQPDWHREIVRGFLLGAAAQGRPFDLVLEESEMPELNLTGITGAQVIKVQSNTETQAQLVDALQAAKASGKRVLLYTAGVFSSHLLKENPLNRVEHALGGKKFFSITSTPLALNSSEEFLVDPPCVGHERDAQGTAALGCEILRAGREQYRQNLKAAKSHKEKNHEDLYRTHFTSIMQQNKIDNDYLLMTAYPGQQGDATGQKNDQYRMAVPGVMGARGLPTSTDPDTRTYEDGGGKVKVSE